MKNNFFYPAIFHKADEGGLWVSFPDFPECFTQGENINEAYKMSADALGLALEDRIKENDIPLATEPSKIECDADSFVVVISFDLQEYYKQHSNKAVRKNITIPAWLDTYAQKNNISLSRILQERLIEMAQSHCNELK